MSEKKTDPTPATRKRLRTLTADDLNRVAGGIKGKPGQYTSSTGGGGSAG